MKSKVVIFTASTGYGHNQVALSMKNELEARDCEVKIIEPFKEVSHSLNIILSDGYRLLATKLPKVYGRMYHLSNKRFLGKPVEVFSIKVIEDELEDIVQNYNPDLIISTHPLIVKAMCSLKKRRIYNGPFISIITDYMPHKSYLSPLVDAYIVGSHYTKDKVVDKGIDDEKIFVYGIPISRAFRECGNEMIRSDRFTVLLMGGSMGVNGIKKVFKELINLKQPLKLIVVCGNNTALKKALEERLSATETLLEVSILGFTNEICQYMDISDIIITKPGGLTVTEAFAKNIPMMIPFYIPGQEQENAEMLFEIGAAVKVDGANSLCNYIEAFINEPKLLDDMKDKMKMVSIDHSLDDAIDLCFRLMTNNK